jgi:hypothetical protein
VLPVQVGEDTIFILQPAVRAVRGVVHGVVARGRDRRGGTNRPQRGGDAAGALERAQKASHRRRASSI